ncbi:hypothetical protein QJS66_23635 (plasmid) [Kocuria rhizophila]|nr:hypothetical protein QJS66_23635 [Kocuria rhizophila]
MAAARNLADPADPTACEIEAARAEVTDPDRELNRRWHDAETERVNPDSIEVTAVLGRPRT